MVWEASTIYLPIYYFLSLKNLSILWSCHSDSLSLLVDVLAHQIQNYLISNKKLLTYHYLCCISNPSKTPQNQYILLIISSLKTYRQRTSNKTNFTQPFIFSNIPQILPTHQNFVSPVANFLIPHPLPLARRPCHTSSYEQRG